MTRIWAKREEQLQRMETGMLNVVGDLQGIGQGATGQLESIAALPELGVAEAENEIYGSTMGPQAFEGDS